LAANAIHLDQKKVWLLPEVFKRMAAGLGEFLMELRPAVAIFIRFEGIDYDQDEEAEKKLDAYIRWVQTSFARYEGNLLQLTIGDKGSYLYGAFGAPLAHEDDVRRAVSVALELRSIPPEFSYIKPVQIGLSLGTMRAGGSGSSTRRTYGVLGDEVNLAARLMQHAAPGEVLVSGYIHKVVPYAFASHARTAEYALVPKPASIDHDEACTIPITFLTAYYGLVRLAQLQPGERLALRKRTIR